MRPILGTVCAFVLVVGLPPSESDGLFNKAANTTPTAPPAETPPATKNDGVIKPETDVDPKIEKPPPSPAPDPANKDIIKPPQGSPQPK